jgi:hypothetical protein
VGKAVVNFSENPPIWPKPPEPPYYSAEKFGPCLPDESQTKTAMRSTFRCFFMKRIKIFFIGFLALFVFSINAFSAGWPGECNLVRQRIIGGPNTYKPNSVYPVGLCVGVDLSVDGQLVGRSNTFYGGTLTTYSYQVAAFYYSGGRWFVTNVVGCQSTDSPGYAFLDWVTEPLNTLYPNGCYSLTDPAKNLGPGCSD